MSERLKNTILCTFLLSRTRIVLLIILEAIITAVMILTKDIHYGWTYFRCNDPAILIFMFTYGISFYEKHTPFCISTAVSTKYRIISQSIAVGSICVITASYDCIIRQVLTDGEAFSAVQLFRIIVCGDYWRKMSVPAAIAESIVFYVMIFAAGYFLGSVKYAKSSGFVLGIMFAASAIIWGTVILGYFTWINPIAWILGTIPAIMLDNAFTAALLYAVTAAGLLYFSYKISASVKPGINEVK